MRRKVRVLALLVGPLLLGTALSTPAEACWLFGCCWGGGRAAFRPVYAGYAGYGGFGGYGGCNSCGVTSYYAPYSSYGGYGCNTCSGGNCGISYYGGWSGTVGCCNSCGGPCDLNGTCSNCVGGDCQLGTPTNPGQLNPDPNAAQPRGNYTDTDTRTGDSAPRTFAPDNRTQPSEEEPPRDSGVRPGGTLPEDPGRFRGTQSNRPTDSGTPVNPSEPNPAAPEAPNPDAALQAPNGRINEAKDGAGFRDELDDSRFPPPAIKVNVDDKIAWAPSAVRTRLTVRPTANTARLLRAAAYPTYSWIPKADETHIAKK